MERSYGNFATLYTLQLLTINVAQAIAKRKISVSKVYPSVYGCDASLLVIVHCSLILDD